MFKIKQNYSFEVGEEREKEKKENKNYVLDDTFFVRHLILNIHIAIALEWLVLLIL